MATTIAAYNDLPSLSDAMKLANKLDAEASIHNEIKDVFRRHQVFHDFGVQLLHRHFDLQPDFIMVEDHTVTGPFPKPPAGAFPSERIVPKSWFFSANGSLQAYEHRIIDLDPKRAAHGAKDPTRIEGFAAFAKDLQDVLSKRGLLRVLGLGAISSDEMLFAGREDSMLLEKTFRDRNIFIKVNVKDIAEHKKETQTSLWLFKEVDGGKDGRAMGVVSKMLCFSGCSCGTSDEPDVMGG